MARFFHRYAQLLALGILLFPSRGRAEVVDRVIAVVGNSAISRSELRERQQDGVTTPGAARPTEREVLQHLIGERLIAEAARKQHIQVDSDEVERAVRDVQANAKLDDAQLAKALHDQGFTAASYRAEISRQLLALKLRAQLRRSQPGTPDPARAAEEEAAWMRYLQTLREQAFIEVRL